jgi:hypothetical protein
MFVFATLVLLFCIIGLVRPFGYLGFARKHYLIGVVVAFIVMMATVEPAPKAASQQIADVRSAHAAILAKAKAGTDSISEYTRKEFPETYRRVGATTFKKLAELEKGAVYAAAESKSCDKVEISGASDKSKLNAAMFFVDCANGNRFMISQASAEDALKRFQQAVLHETSLAESCTTNSVALCNASPAQKAMKEAEAVTICDMIVERALISGDADTDWSWNYSFAGGDTVRVVRGFKSTNGFGAKLQSRYFCDIDARTKDVTRLVIETPFGSEKVI